jgi:membrane protease YdiL (CAAX protease family)
LLDAVVIGVLLEALMLAGVLLQFSLIRLRLPVFITHYQRSELWMLALLAVQFAAVGALVVRIAHRRGLGDPLSSIGWNANNKATLWMFAGIGLAGLMSLAVGTGRFPDGFAPTSIFLFLLDAMIAEPFVEECYFRGILFVAVAQKIGEFGAVISTAVLFTLFHFTHDRWVFFPVALVLGLVRMRAKSVASCFVLHGGYNLGILIFELVRWR